MEKQPIIVIKYLDMLKMTREDVLNHLRTLLKKEISLEDVSGKAHNATKVSKEMVEHATSQVLLAHVSSWLECKQTRETYIQTNGQYIKAQESYNGLWKLLDVNTEVVDIKLFLPGFPIGELVDDAQEWIEIFHAQIVLMKAMLSKGSEYIDQSKSFTDLDRTGLKDRIAELECNLDNSVKSVDSVKKSFDSVKNRSEQLPRSNIVSKPFWKAILNIIRCSSNISHNAYSVHALFCKLLHLAEARGPNTALYKISIGQETALTPTQ